MLFGGEQAQREQLIEAIVGESPELMLCHQPELDGAAGDAGVLLDAVPSDHNEAQAWDSRMQEQGRPIALAIQLCEQGGCVSEEAVADYFRQDNRLRMLQVVGEVSWLVPAAQRLMTQLAEDGLPERWLPEKPVIKEPVKETPKAAAAPKPTAAEKADEPTEAPKRTPAWKRGAQQGRRGLTRRR